MGIIGGITGSANGNSSNGGDNSELKSGSSSIASIGSSDSSLALNVPPTPPGPLLKWEIGRLPKEITPQLEGGLTFNEEKTPDEIPTLRAEFQVKMMAASGLKVDGLAIRGVNYKPFKGVRSITQAGIFQIRCAE
jgi:hypothetical protein